MGLTKVCGDCLGFFVFLYVLSLELQRSRIVLMVEGLALAHQLRRQKLAALRSDASKHPMTVGTETSTGDPEQPG